MTSSYNIAKALIALLDSGVEPEKVAEKFMVYVERFKMYERLPQIIIALESAASTSSAAASLVIESPTEVSAELVHILRERLGVPSEIPVVEEVNKEMIGGVTATYADKHLDASIDTKIEELKAAVKQ